MGNENQPKKNLVERMETLEFQLSRVTALQGLVMNLRQNIAATVETLTALTEELGGQELLARVVARIDEKQAAVRREQAERSEVILKNLIETGQAVPVDVIGPDTIVTGVESTVNGRIKGEKLQMPWSKFTEDVQMELLGKGVGYEIKRQDVVVFKVDGIYVMREVVPAPMSEVNVPGAMPPEAAPAVATPETDAQPQVQEALAKAAAQAPVDVENLPSAESLPTPTADAPTEA